MTRHRFSKAAALGAAVFVLLTLAPAAPASAQPLTDRTPNLEGTWITAPHDLFFQFSHRFQIAGTDADISDLFGDGKVVNYPTIAFSYGLFSGAMLGVRYSSNSLIAGQANEWQPYLKYAPLRAGEGGGPSLSLLGAWNAANESFDGELAAQFDRGPISVIGGVRGFSNPFDRPAEEEEAEFAVAGGALLRLNRYVTVSGDYANMVTQSDAQIGWSAGVSLQIPYTPHTFALFATNVTSGTLEGASVGVDGTTFWGFEFTVRLSGHRWGEIFKPSRGGEQGGAVGGGAPAGAPVAAPAEGAPRNVVEVEISNMRFQTATLTVPVGTTIRWVNRDPVAHTSTSDDGLWESPLFGPGESFELRFDEAGTYPYHCAPHPFMKATVVVTEAGGAG